MKASPFRISRRRTAMTLVETMISVGILIIVILVVVPAMVYYARIMKGISTQNKMQRAVNLLFTNLEHDTTTATKLQLTSGNKATLLSNENTLYEASAGIFTYSTRSITTDLTFFPGEDDDFSTFDDNQLVMTRTIRDSAGTVVDTTRKIMLRNVRRAANAGTDIPVFQIFNAGTPNEYILMTLRVGDSVPKPTADDDRITGVGYQGFLIRSVLSPGSSIT